MYDPNIHTCWVVQVFELSSIKTDAKHLNAWWQQIYEPESVIGTREASNVL